MATQAMMQTAVMQAPTFGGLLGTVFDNIDGVNRQMGPVTSNDFYIRLNPAGDSWQITAVPSTE
jgi:hypothetical protein